MFQHPSGYQVEAKAAVMVTALKRLQPLWPRGLRIGAVFPDVSKVMDDLKLLQRNGLIELRCIDPSEFGIDQTALNRLESQWDDYVTSPYHTREVVPSEFKRDHVDINPYPSITPFERRAQQSLISSSSS
jgi:hypothetical protein